MMTLVELAEALSLNVSVPPSLPTVCSCEVYEAEELASVELYAGVTVMVPLRTNNVNDQVPVSPEPSDVVPLTV